MERRTEKKKYAVIHILHGMMEHSGRYEGFSEFMVKEGIAVYTSDLPGHGKAVAKHEEPGHLDIRTGWQEILGETARIQRMIRQEHSGMPVFLLGHSFGSVVARSFSQKYGVEFPLSGLILSGSMQQPPALLKAGLLLVALQMALHGQKYPSRLMITLGHGQYHKKFRPKRTDFDWLCSDPVVVDKYLEDPLCGYACSLGFYHHFFQNLLDTWKCRNIRRLPAELPVLVFGGGQDPAVREGKDLEKITRKYRRCGLQQADLRIFPQGRHEMLNEVNKNEVWQWIKDWIDEKI